MGPRQPPPGTRVLIAEGEVRLAESLRRGLSGDGFDVEVVHDGASALSYLEHGVYEILLLDRDLPVLHGDIVARTLRDSGSHVRILMLTAAAQTQDMVHGLNLGADDYLPKPFDYEVLLARLRALSRRLGTFDGIEYGGLRVDPESRRAWVEGREVRLRPKEFGVLAVLVRAAGGVVAPTALFDAVWGEDNGTGDAVVKTVIHSLRKKLGVEAIRTVHGAGYRIEGS